MWLLLLVSIGLVSYVIGVMTGKAVSRKAVHTYERGLNEVGKFARQQSAVGDPTGTVVADMIENIHNNKEVH